MCARVKKMVEEREFVGKTLVHSPEAEPLEHRFVDQEFEPYRPFDPNDKKDVKYLAKGRCDTEWSCLDMDYKGKFIRGWLGEEPTGPIDPANLVTPPRYESSEDDSGEGKSSH